MRKEIYVQKLEVILQINASGKFKFRKYLFLPVILSLLIVVVIIVKAASSKLDIPVETFKSKNYQDFEKYARKAGAKKSYDALKSYFKANELDAHDFAHVVGFVAADEGDIDGIKVCDNFYNYGCYHGFMQIYLQKHGVSSVVDMEKSCLSLGQVSAPSCLHGIGHGLMMEAAYLLASALKNCELLQVQDRTYCFDGVFMERIAGSMLPQDKKLKIAQDNLFDPCNSVNKIYGRECWRNQVAVWFSYFSQDPAKIGSYCASLEREYWETCFETLGLLLVQHKPADLNQLISACQIVDKTAHDFCIVGEVKELLFEGKDVNLAYSLCSYVTDYLRQKCFATYEMMFAEYQQRFIK